MTVRNIILEIFVNQIKNTDVQVVNIRIERIVIE